MTYLVLVCSNCHGYWITHKDPTRESVTCKRCNTKRPREKVKVVGRADTKRGAVEVRTELLKREWGYEDANV